MADDLMKNDMRHDITVPGIADVPRLVRWLDANGVPAGRSLSGIELFSGGKSNLTYRLSVPPGSPDAAGSSGSSDSPGAGGDLVLRRPPLGHVLPTAHDMGREYRVISALHGTDVPVPEPVAHCPDPEVIGAPFYVMRYVPGLVLRTAEDADHITTAQATEISERLVDTLAAIHQVDVAAVGLDGFGRPDGYLARQLKRWQRQWELSVTRELPSFDRLVTRLAERLPPDGAARPATLVHGDFRLDNVLIETRPRVRINAVVDWEMSTLGDPLADVGLTLTYWADPEDTERLAIKLPGDVTARPGFLSSRQFAERYAQRTGRDIAGIGYYMAFGCFKLAVVSEGIHARFLQHQTVGEGFEQTGEGVPVLVERAHRLLDELGS
jgi:aminoglycoside phosphotransferase (APT) family kinase protein